MIRKGAKGAISTPCMGFAGPLNLPLSQLELLSYVRFLDADSAQQRQSLRQSNLINVVSAKIMDI
jgi:hypothetical protein